jgi:hypothetical protein
LVTAGAEAGTDDDVDGGMNGDVSVRVAALPEATLLVVPRSVFVGGGC